MLSKDEASIDTAGSLKGAKCKIIALVAASGVFPEYKTKVMIIVLEKTLRTLPLNSRKRRVRAEHHAARNISK